MEPSSDRDLRSIDEFYARLIGFRRFDDLCDDSPFAEVPPEWWILMSDVRGSTQAIREGRYQDVNMAGAAAVAAILNVAGGREIPFVFGGDGATFLVPPSLAEAAKVALTRTRTYVRATYGFELRVGAVPILALEGTGATVRVAKFELSQGNTLAFFRGGGITMAEELIKKGAPSGASYLLPDDPGSPAPDLTGLSCRWRPLETRNGTMISILIQARDEKRSNEVYSRILQGLRVALDADPATHTPVSEAQFKPQWPPKSFIVETSWQRTRFQATRWLARMGYLALTGFLHFCILFDRRLGRWQPSNYKREMKNNADFRKFDDMLRMVLDCSETQADRIEALLTDLHHAGDLFYGLHRSEKALMTCMVFSPVDNQHVHFIDGADGGYAMAATGLKEQIARASSSTFSPGHGQRA